MKILIRSAKLKINNIFFVIFVISTSIILRFDVVRAVPNIIYVKWDAVGANDGASWNDAFTDLQDALSLALEGDEIWVASGIYHPGPSDDPELSFNLQDGVAIYGGFLGSETDLVQRDWINNITVLSADIGNNDTTDSNGLVLNPRYHINGVNSFHVVTASDISRTSILDGFSITAGKCADCEGAGILNMNSSATLTNLNIVGNYSGFRGGGMSNIQYSNPLITDVIFMNNFSNNGGGVYNLDSNIRFNNVKFDGNLGDYVGAMNNENSNLEMLNVSFNNNRSIFNNSFSSMDTNLNFPNSNVMYTGYIFRNFQSNSTLTNISFANNKADNILYSEGDCSLNLLEATISENETNYAINCFLSEITVNTVSIINNSGVGFKTTDSLTSLFDVNFNNNLMGGMVDFYSDSIVTQVVFSNNSADIGGGMYNLLSNPILTDVSFSSNSANRGGGIGNVRSNPILTNVSFSDNVATSGGGIANFDISNPNLTNVTFSNNSANEGGGMLNGEGSSPNLTNITFVENNAIYGGAIHNKGASNPILTNITFNENNSDYGGAISNSNSIPVIRNTIFWGNSAVNGNEIYNDNSTPSISFSVLSGGCPMGSLCSTIFTEDPHYGIFGNYGGFTKTIPLLNGSSAIDRADDDYCPNTDQRGFVRPQGFKCDIGAYESEFGRPYFVSTPVTNSIQDEIYTYNIIANDMDLEDIINISGITLPNWLSLTDNGEGRAILSGTPTDIYLGENPIAIKVTDNHGLYDLQDFVITVDDGNYDIFLPLIKR